MPDDGARRSNLGVVRDLGLTSYEPTWRAMQAFTLARDASTADEIWITEHLPVYTLGLAGRLEHVRAVGAIPVVKTDRGGQVTYHGPGQLVAYLLLDLKRRRVGVRSLVRAMESAVVEWLARFGVSARGREDAPGVYVMRGGREAKIAALGLRVRNGCTYHGVAVNLAMDLAPFDRIDPCGHRGLAVAQLAHFAPAPDAVTAGDALAPILFRHIDAAA